MGILFALLSALFFALSNFVSKVSLNKSKYPDAVGVIFQLVAGIASLAFVLQDGMRFQEVSLTSWILLLVTTTIYGLATLISFRSGKVLDISLTSIISQLTLLFGFVGSLLIFNESITANKIIGVLFILVGNIVIVFGTKFNKLDSRMIMLRIFNCIIIASGNLIDANNSKNFPLSFYMFVGYFGGGIIAYFGSRVSIAKLKEQLHQNLKGQLIMGIASAISYYCFLQAFVYAEKSIVIPITYSNSVILVILGILFLRETKSLWKKIVAILIVFFGSVLINL